MYRFIDDTSLRDCTVCTLENVRLEAIIALTTLALAQTPAERGLSYLSDENGCFSCHNNGDAARALYAAIKLGRTFDPQTLSQTNEWLSNSQLWQ
jgi:hypothetical protein